MGALKRVILIISNKWDVSVDFIVKELRQRNKEFIRLNTEIFPKPNCHASFPDFSFVISDGYKKLELANNLKSVLFRRPGKPFDNFEKEHKKLTPALTHSRDQWHAFIEGILCLNDVLWINNPKYNDIMENKIMQLKKASEIGFNIPKTCITSDKKQAEKFLNKCNGEIIAKSLYSPLIEYEKKDFFIFTNLINSFKDVSRSEIEIAPIIFQEYLKEKIDYRVTVVGDKIFPVRIESSENYNVPVDWRTKKNGLRFIPTDIPKNVAQKCIKFVSGNNLIFGAIDLIRVSDIYYFLEINPNGEWGWLQKCAKLPIAETITDYLTLEGKNR